MVDLPVIDGGDHDAVLGEQARQVGEAGCYEPAPVLEPVGVAGDNSSAGVVGRVEVDQVERTAQERQDVEVVADVHGMGRGGGHTLSQCAGADPICDVAVFRPITSAADEARSHSYAGARRCRGGKRREPLHRGPRATP